MKEIVTVIRPGKDRETKRALAKIGCFACTSVRVFGRGRQRGLKYGGAQGSGAGAAEGIVMKYLPKKMLSLVVDERQTRSVVETLIRVNQTGQYGDGKIFVLEVKETYRIRTGEKGRAAIQ